MFELLESLKNLKENLGYVGLNSLVRPSKEISQNNFVLYVHFGPLNLWGVLFVHTFKYVQLDIHSQSWKKNMKKKEKMKKQEGRWER